jgi:sensor histidine kinase YesM
MKTKKYITSILFIVAALVIINLLASGTEDTFKNIKFYFIYSGGFMLFNSLYYYGIGKVLSWDKNPERTLIISILGSIPVNALIYFVLNYLLNLIIFHNSFDKFLQRQRVPEYIGVILFSLLISLLIMTRYFFRTIREEKLRADQLKIKNEQIKYESLKAQLDPHFLFNNLNVLISLIDENPQEAEDFTIKLSDIYRYVLEQKDQKLVLLSDELSFAKKYLALLKVRFEDDLTYSLPKTTPNEAKLPPLSLQILLENAIKHNAISSATKLHISIDVDNNVLIVSNNKNPKQNVEGYQIGLKNIAERYRLLSDKQAEIIEQANIFTVKLPLL